MHWQWHCQCLRPSHWSGGSESDGAATGPVRVRRRLRVPLRLAVTVPLALPVSSSTDSECLTLAVAA